MDVNVHQSRARQAPSSINLTALVTKLKKCLLGELQSAGQRKRATSVFKRQINMSIPKCVCYRFLPSITSRSVRGIFLSGIVYGKMQRKSGCLAISNLYSKHLDL